MTSRPLNRFDIARLTEHGINTVLQVTDYESFYETVAGWGSIQADEQLDSITKQFEVSGVIRRLGADRQQNLAFLLRDPKSAVNGHKSLPAYYVRRDIEENMVKLLGETPLVLVRGRRFSGRTLLLKSIAASAITKNVFFVDSNSSISVETLEHMLEKTNSLFLFDTNSLTSETAFLLTRRAKDMLRHGSGAVVAASRTEPEVVGSMMAHVEDRADFELSPRLSAAEIKQLNQKLDRLGLLRFDSNRTLLENTYLVLRSTPQMSSELTKSVDVNEREFELILIVAVANKAFSNLATALNIRVGELYALCERVGPLLDLAEAGRGERMETHSRYKVISNSHTGLGLFMRRVIDERGYDWLSARFANLVRRLITQPPFRSLAQSMYMFDAVNYVLSLGEGSGAGYRPVVRNLYQDLQPDLSASADYWLQRAKAVLAIEDEQHLLLEGIQFATKAFREAERERTADNAEFLIALLYGKLCSITKYRTVEYVTAAIQWFANAIRNYARNPNYVRGMLDKGRHHKDWFEQLCHFLSGPLTESAFLPFKGDVDFLLSTRRSLGARGQIVLA